MSINACLSSERMDWLTPPEVVDVVRRVSPLGTIALDPCGNRASVVGARRQYLVEDGDDGLALPWHGAGGLVYVNPPYGRSLPAWIDKCADEAFDGAEIVALVPARPDTLWFRHALDHASAICFWSGRIRFFGATAGAPFPSVFIHFDSYLCSMGFAKAFNGHGVIVDRSDGWGLEGWGLINAWRIA